ncbi:uncharacterized protein N7458_000988 [Penicillium daleae]|uniref:Rhodopsin domain-containing protein n=1 Tax=Penicillium daleae TaxID=63821 RepID=A0AAD6CHC3_9EURO|nr:uncharacterized protein N7458_000988 [Penicillium daleae]KAJ5465302.1 hypothetical protein N7458_000988 [Penicillium daleae]
MPSSDLTPARPPPDGLGSNFVNPTSCGTKFIVVNCIFLPIAFISIVIRVWTRMFITREFRLRRDDVLMIAAFVLSSALSAVTLRMVKLGMGRHMWDVLMSNYSPTLLQLNLSAAIFYNAGTGFLKVSVLLFYIRIFPSRNFHIAAWVLIFIAAGYNIAGVLANIFSCNPIAKTWDVRIVHGTCINRPVFYFVNACLGILTDFATVLIPVPWIRRLQLPPRQKVLVLCILAMGCFVGIVSCIRLYSLYTFLRNDDLTWTSVDALIWCLVELDLGIAGGCVTAMRPFARKYFPRLLGLSPHGTSGDDHPLPSDQNLYPLYSVTRTGRARLSSLNYHLSPKWGPKGDNLSQEQILPPAAE